MDNDETSVEIVERLTDRPLERTGDRGERSKDTQVFLKGIIVGFGLAAVASAAFGLFRLQAERRKEAGSTGSRIREYDESGNILGDLSNIIDESSGAFRDAVQALDQTFESGRQALDTFSDVVDKMRE